MRLHGSFLALLVGAFLVLGGQASAEPVSADRAGKAQLERSTVDRPDDFSGPQVHFVYVLPSDGADQQLDTSGQIAEQVEEANVWLFEQTGLSLSVDTYQGELDVSFLRMPASSEEIRSAGLGLLDRISGALQAAGYSTNPATRRNVAIYGGTSPICGQASWPPLSPGNTAVVVANGCGGTLTVVHEVFHTFGIVREGAPNYGGGGHACCPGNDLMASGTSRSIEDTAVDPGHDDYWDFVQSGAGGFLVRGAYGKLQLKVTGPGSVEAGDDICFDACSYILRKGKTLELKAEPDDNSRLVGWSGGCSGSSLQCSLTLNGDMSVTAAFTKAPSLVKLRINIAGKGTVRGAGLACTKTCVRTVPEGKRITLTAVPAKKWRFVGWKGCAARCTVSLTSTKTIKATFVLKR